MPSLEVRAVPRERGPVNPSNGLVFFFAVTALLFLLRLVLPYLNVPLGVASFVNIVLTLIFMGLPLIALYWGASHSWSTRLALSLLGIGVLLHVGGVLLVRAGAGGFSAVILTALAQTGLMLWCVALGALLALLIKDKNLILPVALFLGGLDVFLVFAPVGPARLILEHKPEVFKSVAYAVPTVAKVGALAFVGPADFFFLAMFFVAIFRFKMRTAVTLRWMLPILASYLLLVIFFGQVSVGPFSLRALPALLPIGLTVLLVNWREFQLNAEEKASTVVVGLLGALIAFAGIWLALRQERQPAPESPTGTLPSASSLEASESAGSHSPEPLGSPQ